MFTKTMAGMLAAGMVFAAASAMAASGKTYQVTGSVLELTATKIVVEKGKEKWELARTATTQVTGDLKVGAKVTIEYTMTATDVTVKADKPTPKSK